MADRTPDRLEGSIVSLGLPQKGRACDHPSHSEIETWKVPQCEHNRISAVVWPLRKAHNNIAPGVVGPCFVEQSGFG